MSFTAGSVREDDREIPYQTKFVRLKCQILGSLKAIQKEYNI